MNDEQGKMFAEHAAVVTKHASQLLEEWFGERCEDFDPDCEVCKRWEALDALVENPFEGD